MISERELGGGFVQVSGLAPGLTASGCPPARLISEDRRVAGGR